MSDKPAEQADHARGAGREAHLTQEQVKEIIAPYINLFQFRDCFEIVTDRLNAVLREPGADTGTTPPIEELISKWSNELVYSLDEAEIDLIEKIAPLILRDIAVAERNRWLKTCASRAEAEAFIATQRAPVEQGPSVLTEAQADRYAAFDNWYDAALKRHKRDELPFSQRAACDYAFEAGMAAALDHAREGALRELAKAPDTDAIVQVDADGLFRYTTRISNAQLKEWRRLAENTTMVSGMGEYTPQSEVIALIDEVEQLRRALADGKEGGE